MALSIDAQARKIVTPHPKHPQVKLMNVKLKVKVDECQVPRQRHAFIKKCQKGNLERQTFPKKEVRSLIKKKEPKGLLWQAIDARNQQQVWYCLSQLQMDANLRNMGWTPLMKAAEDNMTDIMEELLQYRADIDATTVRSGRCALSFAAAPSLGLDGMWRPAAIQAMRVLLDAGANMDMKDKKGLSPLGSPQTDMQHEAVAILSEKKQKLCSKELGIDQCDELQMTSV